MAGIGSIGKFLAPRPKGSKTKPKRVGPPKGAKELPKRLGDPRPTPRTLERDPNKPRTPGVEMPYTGPKRAPSTRGRITGPKKKGNSPSNPKRKTPGMGGPAVKAKPSTGGMKVFPGTGYTTPNKRMPDLQKPGGIRDKAVAPVKPKTTPKTKAPSGMSIIAPARQPKPKYTLLPRKTTPNRSSKMGR